MLDNKFNFVINKFKFIQIFCKVCAKTMLKSNILSFQKVIKLFFYYFEIILQKINCKNRRLLTSKEDFVTIIILSNKTKIINNCVSCYKKNLTNCKVMFICIIIIAQAIANAYVYKQTNITFIKVVKLEKKNKS